MLCGLAGVGAARGAARLRDERLLRKDVLSEPFAEEVGGDGGEHDREQRVDVQRPERELAAEDEAARHAGEVEQPHLRVVDAQVDLVERSGVVRGAG